MTQPFSIDLRKRVYDFIEQGNSRRSAAGTFCVSVSFAVALMRHVKETGSLEPLPCGGTKEGKLAPHHDYIFRRIKEKPDITMPELASELEDRGAKVHPSSISRFLCRKGYSYKKNSSGGRARAQ